MVLSSGPLATTASPFNLTVKTCQYGNIKSMLTNYYERLHVQYRLYSTHDLCTAGSPYQRVSILYIDLIYFNLKRICI